jgi:hypothetical protein
MHRQLSLAVLPLLFTTQALAHPGHLAESAGHAHWIALAALALAVVIVAAGLWRKLAGARATAKAEGQRD